ncbi:hypothetical protein [Jiangella muralis]|uniref:hypothetical protein n=1 Tax=Jiangella muralis TaxID=702383 RepID=UPI00069CEC52|nr:hypothetical protein [Jiangella muralis]
MTRPSPLLIPAGETRAQRRARIRAQRGIRRDAAQARREQTRRVAAADRAAAPGRDVPHGGEHRPGSLRTWRRLRLPAHRATTATLAAAYLFQAEGGLALPGMVIGHDAYTRAAFCFDPWVLYAAGVLTNPNVLIAGEIGSGKSALAKTLIGRGRAFGHRAYVPGDVKGEWTQLAAVLGGATISLGAGRPTRLNPLDAGRRPHGIGDPEWNVEVRSRRLELLRSLIEQLGGQPISPTERTALAAAVDAAVDAHTTPVLPHVVDHLFAPDQARPVPAGFKSRTELREAGRQPGHLLATLVFGELAGLVDAPSTVRFDPSLSILTIDISALGETNPALPLVMACTSAWTEAALRDPSDGQRFIVYDEAWRILRELALARRMQTQWKLSRAWGLSNVAVVHRLSDFAAVGDAGSELRALSEGLVADTATRIVYRQRADQVAATATALGLTGPERALLTGLAKGTGLWRIGERSGQITVHTLAPSERAIVDTDHRMIHGAARG